MRILVTGSNGMIGSTMLRVMNGKETWKTFGTVRRATAQGPLSLGEPARIFSGVDLENPAAMATVMQAACPDVVINCAGLTKHRPDSQNPLSTIAINSLAPHRLANLCGLAGARLIHISTDCVFSGSKGDYNESDFPDATDLYGRSKSLGEVILPNTVTVRTSTIGHEHQTRYGLLEWFLSQENECLGFTKAIFSGLPTVVFAEILRDHVIPNPSLSGLYHVSANPINKADLLRLVADVYGKDIRIKPNDSLVIDRSLNSSLFREATGYVAPAWPELIRRMHDFK